MRIFLLLILFSVTNAFSQEFLIPTKKKTFALNRHTNRDVSYFSKTDSNNDIIITGTTERDTTFTDILTTKLDKDLNLIWQKRYSLGMYTSYDVPLASHIDKNDNIITIGRTIVDNRSNQTGVLFAVSYDSKGSELWHLEFDDPNMPKNYNYYYQKSFLDENNILHVINSVANINDPSKTDINFYSIDDKGKIIEKFTRTDLIDYIGYANVFSNFYYSKGFYYMITKRLVVNATSDRQNFIKKISKNSLIDVSLNTIIDPLDNDAFEDAELQMDKSDNVFLSYSSYKYGFLNVLKFDSSLQLIYKTKTPEKGMRHLLSTSLNSDGHLCVLNNIDKNESNNSNQLSLLEFGDDGSVFKESLKNDVEIFRFKKNEDKSFFIETKAGSIKVFSEYLDLINDFDGTGLSINDMCRLDNATLILAGTTYDKAYPTSDYYTDLDLIVQKINSKHLLKSYKYSGEGTSKAYGEKIIIDNKNNYIIASEEKLGPDNLDIGGSRAPVKRSLYKYDSNLNLLWVIEIPYQIVAPLTSEDKNILIDSENNIYINARAESGTYKLLKISEKGEIIYDMPSYQAINLYFDKNKNINVVSLPVSNPITIDDDTTIYTLSSSAGNLISSKLFAGIEYLGNYNDKNGDSFIYMFPGNNNPYNNMNPRIEVYKNLDFEFQRKISLEGTYSGMLVFTIDASGTLFFSSSYGQVEYKFHRLNLLNDYKYINVDKSINRIFCTSAGNNFAINENAELSIYNNNLEVIARGEEPYSGYSSLYQLGDYLLVSTYWDNLVKVVDKNARLVRSFKLPSSLTYNFAVKDKNDDLVLTGSFGFQVYTYSHYGWFRGFLHKYDILDQMLEVKEFDDYLDNNDITIYPNPSKSFVNIGINKESVLKIELFDFTGKLVSNYINTNKIDISGLPNALYFLKIQLTEDKVYYRKILKN